MPVGRRWKVHLSLSSSPKPWNIGFLSLQRSLYILGPITCRLDTSHLKQESNSTILVLLDACSCYYFVFIGVLSSAVQGKASPRCSWQESLVATRALLTDVVAIPQRSSKYNPLDITFSFVKLIIVFPYIGDSGSHTFWIALNTHQLTITKWS